MKLLLLTTIASAGLLFSNAVLFGQGRVAPPSPFEDHGACPVEGCTYREWTAKEKVAIRATRQTSAAVVFSVQPGENVTALTGVVITVRPGHVQFRERTTLRSATGDVQVVPGETLYLLTYQGEGFTKAWLRGQLLTDVDTVQFINGVCDDRPSRCTG